MITTRAIDTLLQIMRDADVPTRRRIEAADALLGFEAPPEAVGQARDYLVTVFEDSEQTIPDRMDALKLARKFESPKIALPTIHTKKQETDRREAWRRYEIAQRHWKLSLAIMATPPPGWADDSYSADYQPPADGWPPWSWSHQRPRLRQRGTPGQVSGPEQNPIVKELAGPSQHLLPATSKTASGSSSLNTSSS